MYNHLLFHYSDYRRDECNYILRVHNKELAEQNERKRGYIREDEDKADRDEKDKAKMGKGRDDAGLAEQNKKEAEKKFVKYLCEKLE